jgi:antitoxin FitA
MMIRDCGYLRTEEGMGSLQIRELPVDVYDALSERARRERRSLAQQAVVELRRMPELIARERRLAVVEELRRALRTAPQTRFAVAPEALVREDRER